MDSNKKGRKYVCGRVLDENKKAFPLLQEGCGDEWARTTDSRIFSPMLYQLSYITPLRGYKSR